MRRDNAASSPRVWRYPARGTRFGTRLSVLSARAEVFRRRQSQDCGPVVFLHFGGGIAAKAKERSRLLEDDPWMG